jgi:hypothetical protein
MPEDISVTYLLANPYASLHNLTLKNLSLAPHPRVNKSGAQRKCEVFTRDPFAF